MVWERRKIAEKTKWNDSLTHKAFLMGLMGATNEQVAVILDMSISTLQNYKKENPKFFNAMEKGKMSAMLKVTESMYLNCIDRYVTEEKVFLYKGKPVIVQFKRFVQGDKWLQTKIMAIKYPEAWSETHRFEVTNNTNINITVDTFKDINFEELKFIESLQQKQIPENAG